MANTVTRGNGEIHIVFDGSTAWDGGNEMVIAMLQTIPNAQSDIFTIRNGSATGVKMFEVKHSSDQDHRQKDFSKFPGGGRRFRPFVVGNEVSASVELILHVIG